VFFFGILIYWLNHVTIPGYVLLIFYAGLYPAVFCLIFSRLKLSPKMRPLWGGLLWVSLEYIRSAGCLAFTWGLMGHTQWKTLPLAQSASWWGVYGISFLIMATNICLLEIFLSRRRGRTFHNTWLWPLALLVATAVAGHGLTRQPVPEETFRIALVQGNFPQEQKWQAPIHKVARTYLDLSDDLMKSDPDLIVWPETAIPAVLPWQPTVKRMIEDWVMENQVPLLFGSIEESGEVYYNAAFLLKPSAEEKPYTGRYDKIHLVPYGESVPLKNIFPFLKELVERGGGGEFEPGHEFRVFEVPPARFGTLICFESTLPRLAHQYARQEVNLLVVITNDAWFKKSSAPYQHAIQSIFRAIENGVPVVRATNTGWTCAFNARGEEIASLPAHEEGWLMVDVPLERRDTLSAWWGELPVLIALGLTLGMGLNYFVLFPKKRKRWRGY
jgi:apolipoprotein N-acyltransferase